MQPAPNTEAPLFQRVDNMLANELVHQAIMPINPLLAGVVARLLGAPSFMSPAGDAAWYARSEYQCRSIPFILRFDKQGNTFLAAVWDDLPFLAMAVDNIDCGLWVEVIPQKPARAATGAGFFRR